MSLADIKAKINAEAQARIRAIQSDNDAQVSAVAQKADNEIRELQTSYKNRFAKEEPEILKRRQIVAELDANKVDLGVKQRLIGESFEAALRQLSELPKDKYLSFVQKLLEQISGEGALFIGKNEKHIDAGWLEAYNGSHKTGFSLASERLPITGGFVLKQGNIDTNCSWDMLVRDIRPDLEADVVKRLFS
ncbi:MAG: V-type ATP synthase subunit E [Synergistaceae bacterium]|jgi:V/A-type H+-transporting ATPase subunit E|nr:V-type ATP synthase subunit E [Synergistaceae bacterium]